MGFLNNSGGFNNNSSNSTNQYITFINSSSFQESNGEFKANVSHGLSTDTLLVLINENELVTMCKYKIVSDNEIEIYHSKSANVKVTIIGFNKVKNEDSAVVGLGVVGKMIIGKNK